MTWFDTKQAAVDPDNPAANEQIPFSEWNTMVTYLKDKIIDKAVNDAAIGDNKILVYKTGTSTFVFETPTTISAINDIPDVVISGVPADNEVLAWDTATLKWINQTAAEAALATTTQLSTLETAAVLNADFDATTFLYATANDTPQPKTPAEVMAILSGASGAEFLFNTQKIGGIVDPTTAQQGATKNYADTRVATKELTTNFTNDYVLVYKTASGKFEMAAQEAAAGLPVVDTTGIAKGSADGTKIVRFEVDGLTTGTTRVMTVPDKDITLCDTAEALLLSGGTMAADLDMGGNDIVKVSSLLADGDTSNITLQGGANAAGSVFVYGRSHATHPGKIRFVVPNVGGVSAADGGHFEGITNTPKLFLDHGLDMNDKAITDMKNSAPSALSGTQKDIEIDIGGTPYYFTVYPTKA